MPKAILGTKFVERWADALDLNLPDEKVYRVVIDAQVGQPLHVYISRYGSDKLLDITPPSASDVEITVA